MGIQAMVTSFKNNSRRVNKPTYFESAELGKTNFRSIRKRTATAKELEAVEAKIKYQNRIENRIYLGIAIGLGILLWWVIK